MVIEHLNDVVAVLSENNLVEVEFVDDDIVKNKGDRTEKEMEIHSNTVHQKATRAFLVFKER